MSPTVTESYSIQHVRHWTMIMEEQPVHDLTRRRTRSKIVLVLWQVQLNHHLTFLKQFFDE